MPRLRGLAIFCVDNNNDNDNKNGNKNGGTYYLTPSTCAQDKNYAKSGWTYFHSTRCIASPRASDAIHPVLREVGLGDSETTILSIHLNNLLLSVVP